MLLGATISAGGVAEVFGLFGTLSIAFAALIIFIQKNYKRLLAYSSIEHAGLMALGFGFGGVAVFATLLHMLYHALAKALIFFAAGNVFLKYSTTKMRDVTGIMRTLPLTGPVLFVAFLAVLGLPPFGLFMTEFVMLSAGMAEYPWVVVGILIALAVLFLGFFKQLVSLLFGKAPEGITVGESNLFTQVPLVLLLGLLLCLSWYLPDTLRSLIELSAASISLNL